MEKALSLSTEQAAAVGAPSVQLGLVGGPRIITFIANAAIVGFKFVATAFADL